MAKQLVIFTCSTTRYPDIRSLGAYRLRTAATHAGFSAVVIDYLDYIINKNLTNEIIDRFIDHNTVVGISTTWFKHKIPDVTKSINNPTAMNNYDETPLPCELMEEESWRSFLKTIKKSANLVVLGGPNVPYFMKPEYRDLIDYGVIGYADQDILDILRYANKQNLLLPHGERNGIKIIKTDNRFDMEQIGTRYLTEDVIHPKEVLPIEISRGCRFKCTFCFYPLNGRKKNDYIRSNQCITDELIYNYEEFGVYQYRFLCDTFNESHEKLEQICEITENLPFKIKYEAYIRHDLLDERQIEYLGRSGLVAAVLGIETLNKKSGEAIGKGMHPEETMKRVEMLKRMIPHCSISTGIILGLPNDSVDNIQWVYELAKQADLLKLNIQPLRIRRKNELLELSDMENHYEKYGYYEPDSADKTSPLVNWVNKHGMSYSDAQLLVTKLCNTPNNYTDLSSKKQCIYPFSSELDMHYVSNDSMSSASQKINRYLRKIKKRYFNKLLS
jgi:radical SAM superfamily enzyme YgiQ (UPF0313 family)